MRALGIVLFLLSLLHGAGFASSPRTRIGFAYWDVGGMYDTIPSRFYDDGEFTPQGSRRWDTDRYTHKIKNIAQVIDSLGMPLVALFGIESEDITRQIVARVGDDYSYIHRTIEGSEGLDFALLYYGDMLFVDRVSTDFRSMHIEGELLSRSIAITLWNGGYSSTLSHPSSGNSSDIRIVAGTLSHSNIESISLIDTASPHEAAGRGNTTSYRGWYMRHRIGVNRGVAVERSGIYIQPWLLTRNRSTPRSTFSKSSYVGGYSSYLPIFVYFTTECVVSDVQ